MKQFALFALCLAATNASAAPGDDKIYDALSGNDVVTVPYPTPFPTYRIRKSVGRLSCTREGNGRENTQSTSCELGGADLEGSSRN